MHVIYIKLSSTLILFILLLFAGCQEVDVANAPGGAESCDPTDTELSEFQTGVLANILARSSDFSDGSSNCLTCHASGAGGYLISGESSQIETDFCNAFERCDYILTKITSSEHNPQYDSALFSELESWVNSVSCR